MSFILLDVVEGTLSDSDEDEGSEGRRRGLGLKREALIDSESELELGALGLLLLDGCLEGL